MAVMKSFDGAKVGGNVPRDARCKTQLHDYGFFECVKGGPKLGTPSGRIRLIKQGMKVDGKKIQELIEFALERSSNTNRKTHTSSYDIFAESMSNTFQHSGGDSKGVNSWWAGCYYDIERNSACFTSIDTGIGILKGFSLRQKWASRPWHQFPRNRDQAEDLRSLLFGKVPSRTREHYRGRGLPSIKRENDEGRIQNLMILSNRARAYVGDNQYHTMGEGCNFQGTIVYWEVEFGE